MPDWLGFAGSALGSIAGLGGSIGSAAAYRDAVADTNKMNYRIWGEQQQHNIDMFNRQNQAAIDMWEMQNAYNDPSAQIERLSRAGLNPYLAMDGNTAGTASSSPAVGTATPAQAPQMQAPGAAAFDYGIGQAFDRMISGLGSIASMTKTKTETDRIGALLPFEKNVLSSQAGFNVAQSFASKSQKAYFDALTRGQGIRNDLDEESFGWDLQARQTTAANLRSVNALMALDQETKQIINHYLPAQSALNIARTLMSLIEADASIDEMRASASLLWENASSQKMDNKIKSANIDRLIAVCAAQAAADEADAGLREIEAISRKGYFANSDYFRFSDAYARYGSALSKDATSLLGTLGDLGLGGAKVSKGLKLLRQLQKPRETVSRTVKDKYGSTTHTKTWQSDPSINP